MQRAILARHLEGGRGPTVERLPQRSEDLPARLHGPRAQAAGQPDGRQVDRQGDVQAGQEAFGRGVEGDHVARGADRQQAVPDHVEIVALRQERGRARIRPGRRRHLHKPRRAEVVQVGTHRAKALFEAAGRHAKLNKSQFYRRILNFWCTRHAIT